MMIQVWNVSNGENKRGKTGNKYFSVKWMGKICLRSLFYSVSFFQFWSSDPNMVMRLGGKLIVSSSSCVWSPSVDKPPALYDDDFRLKTSLFLGNVIGSRHAIRSFRNVICFFRFIFQKSRPLFVLQLWLHYEEPRVKTLNWNVACY
jgi:hypothetical protein